ncbi:MAG: fibronectin type III domain-containing protein [Eubacterium sp.]
MEKVTQKFLAILMCLAVLCSFPIASQASEADYAQRFTGTYTAPIDARNVLVSGNGAYVSEWYGDRVNMNGTTYSVRQNEYGLNKDGNMIKMELNQTYTIWLAQYGFASFEFTPSADGKYIINATENETYGHFPSWENESYGYTILREIEDGRQVGYQSTDDYLIIYGEAGKTVYIAAGARNNMDYVYDLTAQPLTKDNCPHDWDWDYDISLGGCKCESKYTCSLCGSTKTEEEENHNFSDNYVYTHEAQNCLDDTTGYRECVDCGYKYYFTWENDGEHVAASKQLEYIGDTFIEYECVCGICGGYFWEGEKSPCAVRIYDPEWDEWTTVGYHSFGQESNLACGQRATCTKCGYQAEGEHSWIGDSVETPISESGNCYVRTYTETCTKCGTVETSSYTYHRGWDRSYEYVQITPQHDNVCGTYNFVCADCGLSKYDTPQTCHSYSNYYQVGTCTYAKTCARCSNVETEMWHDNMHSEIIYPTCTTQGGTLYTCSDCGTQEWEDVVPPTGHNFGNNNPTCFTCGAANPNYVAPQPTPQPTPIPQPEPQPAPVQTTTQPVAEAPAMPKKVKSGKVTYTLDKNGDYVSKKAKKSSVKKVTAKKKAMTVNVDKVSKIKGYEVEYTTDKKFKKNVKKIAISKSKTSATIKKLKSKKTYYVRVRTYTTKKVNGKTVKLYSSWSKVKSVKVK